jgi:Ca2+-binding EF-hand superfamily protein
VAFLSKLSPIRGEFNAFFIEVPADQYLGARGAHALSDVIRVNRSITRLSLSSIGLDDSFVIQVCPTLHNHDRLTSVDLSGNPDITEYSMRSLLALVKENSSICKINVEGTGLSASVQRKLHSLTRLNEGAESLFLSHDWVGYKKMFIQLDVDRSGAISVLDVVSHLEHIGLASSVEKRFQIIDYARDAKVDIEEFLVFFHLNYFATMQRMEKHLQRVDVSEDNIVLNWKMLREAAKRSMVCCKSFHLARIPHRTLSFDEAIHVIQEAVEHEHHRTGETPDCLDLKPINVAVCAGMSGRQIRWLELQ